MTTITRKTETITTGYTLELTKEEFDVLFELIGRTSAKLVMSLGLTAQDDILFDLYRRVNNELEMEDEFGN